MSRNVMYNFNKFYMFIKHNCTIKNSNIYPTCMYKVLTQLLVFLMFQEESEECITREKEISGVLKLLRSLRRAKSHHGKSTQSKPYNQKSSQSISSNSKSPQFETSGSRSLKDESKDENL